jgi:hypothetical protein
VLSDASQLRQIERIDAMKILLNRHQLLGLLLPLIALAVLAGAEQSAKTNAPVTVDSAPPVQPATLSAQIMSGPNRITPLAPESTDTFLRSATNSTVGQLAGIRSELNRVAKDPVVIDALSSRLLALPVDDVERHLTILSSLGEMRNPRAIVPLKQFIWTKTPVVAQPAPGHDAALGSSFFNHDGALRARAVEMLAYINTGGADSETLHVAADHPNLEVRMAAMDSYLFNHGDSDQAKAELEKTVRPDEVKLIGLPRLTAGGDPKLFDQQVADFYKRYPDELPPAPTAEGSAHRTPQVVARRQDQSK